MEHLVCGEVSADCCYSSRNLCFPFGAKDYAAERDVYFFTENTSLLANGPQLELF